MNITLHMRMTAAVLLLTLAAQGQPPPSSEPSAIRSTQPSQDANQNTASQTLAQPNAPEVPNQNVQQPTPSQSSAPCMPTSSPTESKDSFSQLTLFLFGSGLAIFIALLGWSDQIRGFDNDTKELEQRFLNKTRIKKRDFLEIVRPKSPEEQLAAFARVDSEGRIENAETIDVLRTFAEELNQPWSRVERLFRWKYKLTIALTIILFLTGIISLFTTPTQQALLYAVSMRAEIILLVLPVLLIGLLLAIIIRSARWEKAVRSILQSMADKV